MKADPERARALADRLLRRIGYALHLARCYPLPEVYALTPGDQRRLHDLGYTGEGGDLGPEKKK